MRHKYRICAGKIQKRLEQLNNREKALEAREKACEKLEREGTKRRDLV